MGGLLAVASISSFLGLIGMILVVKSSGGGFLLFLAMALNCATIVRLNIERKNEEGSRFRTSQIIYIASSIICVLTGGYHLFAGWTSSKLMGAGLFIGFAVLPFISTTVAINYWICQLEKQNKTGKGQFFLPSDEDRDIKKTLKIVLGVAGVLLFAWLMAAAIVSCDSDGGGNNGGYSNSGSQRCNNCGGDGWDSENNCKCVWCGGDGKTSWNP